MHTVRLNGTTLSVADPGDPGYGGDEKTTSERLKVGAKGGISVYGLQRFPVTLYAGQWRQLAAMMPEILDFIVRNSSDLSEKK